MGKIEFGLQISFLLHILCLRVAFIISYYTKALSKLEGHCHSQFFWCPPLEKLELVQRWTMDEHGSHVYLLDQSLHLIYEVWFLAAPTRNSWLGGGKGRCDSVAEGELLWVVEPCQLSQWRHSKEDRRLHSVTGILGYCIWEDGDAFNK